MGISKGKNTLVYVTAVDTFVTVILPSDGRGAHLISAVCEKLNIFERDWFGLYYIDSHNEPHWLEDNDKIDLRKIKPQVGQQSSFDFRIRYYPECIKTEVIHYSSKIYFFKYEFSKILTSKDVYYAPEELVISVIAFICLLHKNDPSKTHREILDSRFPQIFTESVLKRYNLSKEEFMDAILPQLEIAKTQHYMEPIEQCLSVIEQSPVFGVFYFTIVNKKSTPLSLGVHCYGINIYRCNDCITPAINFLWSEVNSVSYEGHTFKIKMVDASTKTFICFTKSEVQSKLMLTTIIGAHKRYLARRSNKDNWDVHIKEAKKAQEEELAKKQAFDDQQKTEFEYTAAVEEIVETGVVDEKAQKLVEESFNEAKKKMEEQILIAQREVEEERKRKEKIEKEAKELEEKAKELAKKLANDEKIKEQLILIEQEKISAEETHKKEMEILNQKLKELEVKHEEDMKLIEKIKAEKEVEAKETEDTSSTPRPTNTLNKSALNKNTLNKRPSYSDVAKNKKTLAKNSIKNFAEFAKTKVSTENVQATQMNEFQKTGLNKFDTLKMLRKNNTRARIDEFEALF